MTDEPYTDYRCSKCDQIGGDSTNGPYDGCPRGGKHDMNGGKV
jgi:DNA-directed RNA polymerase subunit RPC12/RpoP